MDNLRSIKSPAPSLSVVIVNFNSGDNLFNCLAALKKQSYALEKIIVVDNNSTDDSITRVIPNFPEIEIIANPINMGLSKARNIGLSQVTTDLVLSLDDDVYVDASAIETMVTALINNNAALVCPRILIYPENTLIQCDGAEAHFIGNMSLLNAYQPFTQSHPSGEAVGATIGACMLMDVESLRTAGLFNQLYFFYFEDLEFSIRLRSLGLKLYCEKSAIAYHDLGLGTQDLSFRGAGKYPKKRAFFIFRNRWMTILITYQSPTIFLLAPIFMIYETNAFIFALFKGWGKAWIRALWSIVKDYPEIRIHRKEFQAQRTISDKHILSGGDIQFAPGLLHSRFVQTSSRLVSKAFTFYWEIIGRILP